MAIEEINLEHIEGAEEGLVHEKDEEIKEGGDDKEEESEYESDGYGEEDYDEEGKYIWGKEGDEWSWYHEEDKEAYENGETDIHPEVMNSKPQQMDDDIVSVASTAATSIKSGDGAIYKTTKKSADTKVWRNS